MAVSYGGMQANMGPFKPVNLKGNAAINGVPMFVDKLPLTLGGIAGDNVLFGRVCSVDPNDPRHFVMGVPSGNVVKGISMLDPSILMLDPGQAVNGQNYYFVGRPMTVTTLGVLDILDFDTTQSAPFEGARVFARTDNGQIAFASTDISGTDYVELNAFVYEKLDPNGAKVFFNLPMVKTQTAETLTRTAAPTADPAAGAVDAGTAVTLTSTTPGAEIFYTIDGSQPSPASTRYTGPVTITAAVTLKAVAYKEGMDVSTTLSAAYTLN